MPVLIFVATSFLSAFLLFQIQPMMAKFLLPWYGGSSFVWTVCLFFFQTVLLAGYGYAHLLTTRVRAEKQVWVHMVLLSVGCLFAGILPGAQDAPVGVNWPIVHLLWVLFRHVGISFFLLSSTAPLLQLWFSRRFPGRSPYPLYAVSNAGSLSAVLSYPLWVEPFLYLDMQEHIWVLGFFGFVAGCVTCSLMSVRSRLHPDAEKIDCSVSEGFVDESGAKTISSDRYVVFLAALGTALLLTTTSQMTQDVAVISLFLVIPLCVFLLTFVLCFQKRTLYHRGFWLLAALLSLFGVGGALFRGVYWSISLQFVNYCVTLLCGCMVAHGELHRMKPGPRYLTRYYLLMSLGGALGGLLVALLPPLLFSELWEYPMTWLLLFLVVVLRLIRERDPYDFTYRSRYVLVVAGSGLLCSIALMSISLGRYLVSSDRVIRSVYGRIAVSQGDTIKCLYHGRILHGCQWMEEEFRQTPTTYYGSDSGVGVAITAFRDLCSLDLDVDNPESACELRIGVVGLGTGTTAAWTQKGDVMRFFEIDPAMVQVAEEEFTYLKSAEGSVDVSLGDARISLERENREELARYQILVLDAFSSDAVPVHLMTVEAFQIFQERIEPDGVLAVHISNRHLRLEPVMSAIARELDMSVLLVESREDDSWNICDSTWVLMTRNEDVVTYLAQRDIPLDWPDLPDLLFTDRYSNVLGLLRRRYR